MDSFPFIALEEAFNNYQTTVGTANSEDKDRKNYDHQQEAL